MKANDETIYEVIVATEELKDLNMITIDGLQGSLEAYEQRLDGKDYNSS